MVNAIFTFAGLPESETDNFEYVNFAENAQGGEVVYAQDRWCGLYCFNADADPSDSNFSLGWYDLWNASLFFKGSVQAAAANTNIPSSIKLLKNEMKLSEMKPLSATEKLHMQSLIRQNLKMKSIRCRVNLRKLDLVEILCLLVTRNFSYFLVKFVYPFVNKGL